ncbi:MAG: hypothetical protein JNN27_07595 [Planctomycetes bacterium]|nr:hypothetical protein [Planctomycetota bacterium]
MTDEEHKVSEAQSESPPRLFDAEDARKVSEAIAEARQCADKLLAEIQERSSAAAEVGEKISHILADATSARDGIDKRDAAMQTAVEAAKQAAESSRATATELKELLASVQAISSQSADTVKQASASHESLRVLVNAATENAGRIEAVKTQIEQSAQVAAARSEHIEEGRLYVDKKRAEIDRIHTAAQQSASSAEAQHLAARTTSDNLSALHVEARKAKADMDSNAEAVARALESCNAHAVTTKALSDRAESTDKRIAEYEKRLEVLEAVAQQRLKTIEALLPGAASAGLASAFKQRRDHFKWPHRAWQSLFVVSVLALLGIAWLEFRLFSELDSALTWDRLGLSLLHRLPFALPIIWLAIHSAQKAALAQRVEEDYAFKETVSRSFEGYRREMAELEGKAAPNSALTQLCASVLGIITNPPGRIYEKHPLNDTPLSALADTTAPLATAANQISAAQQKT